MQPRKFSHEWKFCILTAKVFPLESFAVYGSSCSDEFLNEFDVPGAALNGRDASSLTIPELKRWLQCRRAPTTGKKADLASCQVNLLFCVKVFNK